MPSSFFGVEVARRGLMAERLALDTTNQNTGNANTPGYSEQTANLGATDPFALPGFTAPAGPGQMGMGVRVEQITRAQDTFIQDQIDKQSAQQQEWTARNSALDQVQTIYAEPSDIGIAAHLQALFAGFDKLGGDPTNMAVRSEIQQDAAALAESFHQVVRQLVPLRQSLDHEIVDRVTTINQIIGQLADLNRQIAQAVGTDRQPDDLLDRRMLLVQKLAQNADVRVLERNSGMIAVTMNGVDLVDGTATQQIRVTPESADGLAELAWSSGVPFSPGSGALAGLLYGRDRLIPDQLDQLNTFAGQLVTRVNAVHRTGFGLDDATGLDFFVGGSAADIALNPELSGDSGERKIAAAASAGAVGDGANAGTLSDLATKPLTADSPATPGDTYRAIMAGLGVLGQQADNIAKHQQAVLDHLTGLRASLTGVSFDEEMMHLIEFQHTYGTSARAMTTMDQILDTLINRTGVVG